VSTLLTDHQQIREWIAARAGNPAIISIPNGHGGYQARLRLTFGQRHLQEQGAGNEKIGGVEMVPWIEWFNEFESQNLALRVPAEQDNAGSAFSIEKRPQ